MTNAELAKELRDTDAWTCNESYLQDLLNKAAEALERVEADNAALHNTLALIEMETRDGGQWGLRDVNEAAKNALPVQEQWQDDARQYARNADYWRERAEKAEAENEALQLALDAVIDAALLAGKSG